MAARKIFFLTLMLLFPLAAFIYTNSAPIVAAPGSAAMRNAYKIEAAWQEMLDDINRKAVAVLASGYEQEIKERTDELYQLNYGLWQDLIALPAVYSLSGCVDWRMLSYLGEAFQREGKWLINIALPLYHTDVLEPDFFVQATIDLSFITAVSGLEGDFALIAPSGLMVKPHKDCQAKADFFGQFFRSLNYESLSEELMNGQSVFYRVEAPRIRTHEFRFVHLAGGAPFILSQINEDL